MNLVARLNGRITQLAVGRHLSRRTVRVRLTLLYGVLFLLSGAALVAITYVLFQRATEYARPQLPQIPPAPEIHHLEVPQAPFLLTQDQQQFAKVQHALLVTPNQAPNGYPVARTMAPLLHDQEQLTQDQHQLARTLNKLAAAVHEISRAGSVEAAQRATDSHQLLVDSGIALAIVAVLGLLASWLLAGRMLRPIRTITRRAQRISSASLHERLALEGPQDELKELGDTLDDLFGRLDAAFEAQRQFVANASHELRAPLTRQRALIQVALANPETDLVTLRTAHERVLAAEQHLEQLIDGLLALTRGQAGLERLEQVDLADLASQIMLARESQFAELALDVHTALAPASTAGDQRLLERLITNLVDNAIGHNLPGGHVEIVTGSPDGRASISIANSGPMIPPGEIDRLFEPFQRLDGARLRHSDGHGLGLSIVKAIANAHHAELSAHARPEGGLTVEVSFPSPNGGADAALRPGLEPLHEAGHVSRHFAGSLATDDQRNEQLSDPVADEVQLDRQP